MKGGGTVCCLLLLAVGAGAADERSFWNNKATVGFDGTSGNSNTSKITADILFNRNNRWVDEYTLRSELLYSASDNVLDARKSTFWARYGFSFGEGIPKPWYGFVKLEADFDEFSDIDSRYVAGPGVGYWLYDKEEIKFMVELAGGIERTRYISSSGTYNLMIASPRAKYEKQVRPTLWFMEDLTGYASLERFRFRSETNLVNIISHHVALRITFVDDFNSSPFVPNIKNNDLRLTFGAQYTFPAEARRRIEAKP